MKTFDIDLYEYYKVQKTSGCKGILHGYILDNNEEVDVNRRNPVMFVIPGGAYSFVSFRESEPICMKYLSYGFKCFWIDYSVAPVRHPHQLMECAMAVNYIREHADELMIDKNKISAVGFSAGGHLCGMLGSIANSNSYKYMFNPTEDVRVNAIILSYPVFSHGSKAHFNSFDNLCGDEEKLKDELDISNLVNSNSAPAFIWSTYNDGCVPVKNSLIAADAYENAGVPFSIHIFGNGWHGSACSDVTVYNNKEYENFTKSITEWVKLSVEWLGELGLYY